jgi:hypothetical protein
MPDDSLPFPGDAELLAALGYPSLPVRVRRREPLSWHPLRDGDEAGRYLYTGEDGEPRFQCIRFHPRTGHPAAPDEAFLWRRTDTVGEWAWGLDGVETVPYRLPRVRAAVAAGERVFVVPGEKDVHALEALGLTATTNPLGPLQWTQAHADFLRGAEVIVIPHADRPGRVHAARVLVTLRARARSAALLLLPLGPGEGVSDWIARGNGAGGLARLIDAAPHDPSPAELAALLDLPPDVDPLASGPGAVYALLAGAGADPVAPVPHPAFRRTVSTFARLGVAVRLSRAPVPPDPGLPDPHPTYLAVVAASRAADADRAPLLEDASLLDRASYELGLFGGLLRASMGEDENAVPSDPGSPETAFATAPGVRLVRTRWDWDGFLADPAQSEPVKRDTTWVLHVPLSGPLRMQRLHLLPALLLEACAQPLTRKEVAAAVAEQVDGDPAQITAVVHAQVDELLASGLLRPCAAAADRTVSEMRRLLLPDEPPPRAGARGVVGLLWRAIRPAREDAEEALRAGDGSYPIHRLDATVRHLDQLLAAARLRHAFSTELDGYWAASHVHARIRSLEPLLDVLTRTLGSGVFARPPYLLT